MNDDLSILIKACNMAILNPVNRRNSTEFRDAKGVDFELEKMKKGLSSKTIDLPKHQSIEERTTWLLEMMEKRKIKGRMFASAHHLHPDSVIADLSALNRVALLEDLTRHVELVEGLGGVLEAEKELSRKCILKWITPEILELTEAIKNVKYLEELKRGGV